MEGHAGTRDQSAQTHLRPIQDNKINSRTSANRSTIYLHTGIRQWLLYCVVILCSCLRQTQHQSTQDKAMETHKHYGPTNKISECAYESQYHFCIHLLRASQRAQTGIVQSLLSEAAQRKHRVTASQNKCQRSSLSCWCLHRLSGNRTIQVHTVCFSVVAFMGCHQWCLSHQSS